MDTRSLIEMFTRGKQPWDLGISDIENVLSYMRIILIAFASFEALVGLILVAMNYFTAYGDEAKAAAAKKRIVWIIVGTIVVILSEILLYEVFNYFVPAYENQAPQIDNSVNPFKTP